MLNTQHKSKFLFFFFDSCFLYWTHILEIHSIMQENEVKLCLRIGGDLKEGV